MSKAIEREAALALFAQARQEARDILGKGWSCANFEQIQDGLSKLVTRAEKLSAQLKWAYSKIEDRTEGATDD